MTKEEQVKVRELIGKISDTCMRINLETERAAFCYISGHVSQISCDITEAKSDTKSYIMKWDLYFGEYSWNTPRMIIQNLTDRLAALEKFLASELEK